MLKLFKKMAFSGFLMALGLTVQWVSFAEAREHEPQPVTTPKPLAVMIDQGGGSGVLLKHSDGARHFKALMAAGHPELEVRIIDGSTAKKLYEGLRLLGDSGQKISRVMISAHGGSTPAGTASHAPVGSKIYLSSDPVQESVEFSEAPDQDWVRTELIPIGPRQLEEEVVYRADYLFKPIQGQLTDDVEVYIESCNMATGDDEISNRKAQAIARDLGIQKGNLYVSKTPVYSKLPTWHADSLIYGVMMGFAASQFTFKGKVLPMSFRLLTGVGTSAAYSVCGKPYIESFLQMRELKNGTSGIMSKKTVLNGVVVDSKTLSVFDCQKEFANCQSKAGAACGLWEAVTGWSSSLDDDKSDVKSRQ